MYKWLWATVKKTTKKKQWNSINFSDSNEVCSMKVLTEPCRSLEYIDSTRVQSTTWPPSCGSVYKQQIYTNNDVEGWHNGLNKRASGRAQMPLYMLIHLLHKEACLVALQIRLVSERKLTKLQRKSTAPTKWKY